MGPLIPIIMALTAGANIWQGVNAQNKADKAAKNLKKDLEITKQKAIAGIPDVNVLRNFLGYGVPQMNRQIGAQFEKIDATTDDPRLRNFAMTELNKKLLPGYLQEGLLHAITQQEQGEFQRGQAISNIELGMGTEMAEAGYNTDIYSEELMTNLISNLSNLGMSFGSIYPYLNIDTNPDLSGLDVSNGMNASNGLGASNGYDLTNFSNYFNFENKNMVTMP